jgi:hypothetical protein
MGDINMFWTKVSKALSDIIIIIATVMGLLLGEGLGEVMDSPLIGVAGFVLGIIISVVAGIAMKALIKTSDSLIRFLDSVDGKCKINNPVSIEELELYEKENHKLEQKEEGDSSIYDRKVFEKWSDLATEIKIIWIEMIVMLILTVVFSYRVSLETSWGAMLVLGFGLVVNMLINAIIGTCVENKYKLERVNYLIKTRHERKNKKC